MAIKDYQAVLFLVLIILLHLSQMNMQDLLAFFHDTLHADLITLVQIMMMFTNMALILNTKWFDITTETFPEHVTTLILHIADKLDILSFAKKDLHFNQFIKGLKTSNRFQPTHMGNYFPNNILSGVDINKLVSRNCALGQQTEAFVKVFGELCRTVFVVVESPDVEEGRLYDIFYDLPLVPSHRPSLHEVEGEKKKKRREHFSLLSRRLETFTNSKLSTYAKTFAESGFFFCGKLDRVCCYECGIVISKWRKEDDPLLEHVRHSLDCPFVVSLLPEDLRHDIREQLQHARRNESSNRKTGLREKIQEEPDLDMNTPAALAVLEYGYTEETVKKAINEMRKKGTEKLTAQGILDILLSYQGTDFTQPTTEIAKPDPRDVNLKRKETPFKKELSKESFSLKISNKNDIAETKDKGQATFTANSFLLLLVSMEDSGIRLPTDDGDIENDNKNDNLSGLQKVPSNNLSSAERLNGIKTNTTVTSETRDNESKKLEAKPDLNTWAALAVLDFGYSRKAVTMAIKELRRRGQATFTANSILQLLVSMEDSGIRLPTDDDDIENDNKNDNLSGLQKVPSNNLSSAERLNGIKTNRTVTSETRDNEVCHLLKDNEKLVKQMICKRCKERQRNILLLPCTHFCLCEQCSKEVSLCPECWKPIKERVKTYVS